mmetsp:Transcript_44321/g.100058  ORF Transcript_44321/g.100058 Transcript_44321/m.100058 type:complete len:282 (+) Transcript_44321:1263-2108(+)
MSRRPTGAPRTQKAEKASRLFLATSRSSRGASMTPSRKSWASPGTTCGMRCFVATPATRPTLCMWTTPWARIRTNCRTTAWPSAWPTTSTRIGAPRSATMVAASTSSSQTPRSHRLRLQPPGVLTSSGSLLMPTHWSCSWHHGWHIRSSRRGMTSDGSASGSGASPKRRCLIFLSGCSSATGASLVRRKPRQNRSRSGSRWRMTTTTRSWTSTILERQSPGQPGLGSRHHGAAGPLVEGDIAPSPTATADVAACTPDRGCAEARSCCQALHVSLFQKGGGH